MQKVIIYKFQMLSARNPVHLRWTIIGSVEWDHAGTSRVVANGEQDLSLLEEAIAAVLHDKIWREWCTFTEEQTTHKCEVLPPSDSRYISAFVRTFNECGFRLGGISVMVDSPTDFDNMTHGAKTIRPNTLELVK